MTTTRKLRWTLIAALLAALTLMLAAGLAYGASSSATQPTARPDQVATATYQPCGQADDGWGHDAAAMRQHRQASDQAQRLCDGTHQQQRDHQRARQEMAEHHLATHQEGHTE